ncbi:efflux RND transporter periplasmic adaptor subunit [Parasphingorhabdus litoris]|uniref:Efflux RND transporter periplasmic adaptor subunit n=1 Tax=Parasphingorhabdus litoris TaxID=394733 RepID=A0ABP3KBZ1_9SPHN|nr:HlyD family efflux transporter periplasmic adaptor subunit [Parasphingorhabdus litoris]
MATGSILQRLRNFSSTGTILSVLAIIAIIVAAIMVITGQPDRKLRQTQATPPEASGAFNGAPSVAGAGVVEPSSEIISIGTSLPGLVMRVDVTPGQQVTRGDPLFAVDDRDIRARITEANASITRARSARTAAEAALTTARQQLALYDGIEDSRAFSKSEIIDRQGAMRNARAQIKQANAEIRAAQAARASAQTDLSRLTVRAPISAEVLNVDIRPGEYVNPGGMQGNGGNNPYMEIGNTKPLHVRIDIDENEISRVAMGSKAIISPRGNASKRVEATFVRAEPLVTPKVSLTNSASERVDVRVLQLIYALPPNSGFFVGQQADAFVRAETKGQAKKQNAQKDEK